VGEGKGYKAGENTKSTELDKKHIARPKADLLMTRGRGKTERGKWDPKARSLDFGGKFRLMFEGKKPAKPSQNAGKEKSC